ncbi:MAG: MBL fold metallo-hydrolase [Bacillota bacterium]|nr:MBL fold metallo-hydrolase [Bacillota bacterium]
MKICTLMDNISRDDAYKAEFGLSYYIETGNCSILFDAGSTHLFAENAEKMDIDLSKVDVAVLSHGHFDHGGGLLHFLKINNHAKVYVAEAAFDEFFNVRDEYIGLNAELMQSDRIVYVKNHVQLAEGVELFCPEVESGRGGFALKYPIDDYGLKAYQDGRLVSDDFRHEMYLLIREPDVDPGVDTGNEKLRTVLFSGCSHRGILNIMSWFSPDVLFGGFHLFPVETYGEGAEKLKKLAKELLEYPTLYYTCHCTGIVQYEFLSSLMEDRIRYLAAGEQVIL